ncbi:MAG TPA: hypothetical protein VFK41_07695 [Nocardioidaceae bacterium]|nr:hypothetical protein [Nocardioidaceae bacterium]
MAGLVLAVLLGAGLWVVLTGGDEGARLPNGGSTDLQSGREQRLEVLLEELETALGRGATGLAAAAGTDQLADIEANVRTIGFSELGFRYVAPAVQSGQQLNPEDTWVADVQVTWQFARYHASQSVLEVPLVIVDDGRSARFGGIGASDADRRVPLWLLDGLAVSKRPRTLVLAADPGRLAPLTRLAQTAVEAVDVVLPEWGGALVLEEPASLEDLNRAVGADSAVTAQLAGVTTTVDGSVVRGSSSHVLLNPTVFDRLGPRAAQIVVTHEATHVATEGAVSSAPQWLVECFGDYVALRDSELPVETAAGQILSDVRKNGPPPQLPTSSDFSDREGRLGAMYEAAWLACRLIAETYGEDALVAFYERADRDGDATAAFRRELGVSEADFTRSWRSYLSGLASTP